MKQRLSEPHVRAFFEAFFGAPTLAEFEQLFRMPTSELCGRLLPVDGIVRVKVLELQASAANAGNDIERSGQLALAIEQWEQFRGELRNQWRKVYCSILTLEFVEFAVGNCGGADGLASDILREELSHLHRQLRQAYDAAQATWDANLQQLQLQQSEQRMHRMVDERLAALLQSMLRRSQAEGTAVDVNALQAEFKSLLDEFKRHDLAKLAASSELESVIDTAELAQVLVPTSIPRWACPDAVKTTLHRLIQSTSAATRKTTPSPSSFRNAGRFAAHNTRTDAAQHAPAKDWLDRLRQDVEHQLWKELFTRCLGSWDSQVGKRLFALPERVQTSLWYPSLSTTRYNADALETYCNSVMRVGHHWTHLQTQAQFICVGVSFAGGVQQEGSIISYLLDPENGTVFQVTQSEALNSYAVSDHPAGTFAHRRSFEGKLECAEVGMEVQLDKPVAPRLQSFRTATQWADAIPNSAEWFQCHAAYQNKLQGVIVGCLFQSVPRPESSPPPPAAWIVRVPLLRTSTEAHDVSSFILIPAHLDHAGGVHRVSGRSGGLLELSVPLLSRMLPYLIRQRVADLSDKAAVEHAGKVERIKKLYETKLEDVTSQLRGSGALAETLRASFDQLGEAFCDALKTAGKNYLNNHLTNLQSPLTSGFLMSATMTDIFQTKCPDAKQRILQFTKNREETGRRYFFNNIYRTAATRAASQLRVAFRSTTINTENVVFMSGSTIALRNMPSVPSFRALLKSRLDLWISRAKLATAATPLSDDPETQVPIGHACIQALAFIHCADPVFCSIHPLDTVMQHGTCASMIPSSMPTGQQLTFSRGLSAIQTALALHTGSRSQPWSTVCGALQAALAEHIAGVPATVTVDARDHCTWQKTITLPSFVAAFNRAYGCKASCPYCGQKCNGRTDGHSGLHRSTRHLICAFGGRKDSHNKADLNVCSDGGMFDQWIKDDRPGGYASMPFDEHVAVCHPDWSIKELRRTGMLWFENVAFAHARQELATHFEYRVRHVPQSWKQAAEEYFGP